MKLKLSAAIVVIHVATNLAPAQTVKVFEDVPFYSMYHYLGEGQQLPPEAFSQIPAGAIRIHGYERDIISRKLSSEEIAQFGNGLKMNVKIKAACDNYDRIAGVNLALVPKGLSTYTWENQEVQRIEIGRFITPFMNKNKMPNEVPYSFQVDNVSQILHDAKLAELYDFWIEFRADGYSEAANSQVAGCAGRTDVFRGDLEFVSSQPFQSVGQNALLPLQYRKYLNNYSATDVEGQTTRIVNFTLQEPMNDARLHLIISNHGANSGGEEYNRRKHFVYVDDQLVMEFTPGGKSCEDFRVYNTQGNGIYSSSPRTLRRWVSWSNWCPGDLIPNREIHLGNLSTGNHTVKINVPDAKFVGKQGYFPISMYLQNAPSNAEKCAQPYNLKITEQSGTKVTLEWKDEPATTQWQTLWGRYNTYAGLMDEKLQEVSGEPKDTRADLMDGYRYEDYVQAKCSNGLSSGFTSAVYTTVIMGTDEISQGKFSIYPNPVKDVVKVESTEKIEKVALFSLDGKKLVEQNHNVLNISNLPKGIYLLKADFTSGKSSTKKVVKE